MIGPLLVSLYIFVLAIFVGFEVITKVPPLLHTPLMSGANAISGITVVGAIVVAAQGGPNWMTGSLAFLAVVFATINVIEPGFAVIAENASLPPAPIEAASTT